MHFISLRVLMHEWYGEGREKARERECVGCVRVIQRTTMVPIELFGSRIGHFTITVAHYTYKIQPLNSSKRFPNLMTRSRYTTNTFSFLISDRYISIISLRLAISSFIILRPLNNRNRWTGEITKCKHQLPSGHESCNCIFSPKNDGYKYVCCVCASNSIHLKNALGNREKLYKYNIHSNGYNFQWFSIRKHIGMARFSANTRDPGPIVNWSRGRKHELSRMTSKHKNAISQQYFPISPTWIILEKFIFFHFILAKCWSDWNLKVSFFSRSSKVVRKFAFFFLFKRRIFLPEFGLLYCDARREPKKIG